MGKLKSCGFLIFRDTPTEGSETNETEPSPHQQISFLLLKHPSRWDLPKGHVDPGETNMECALRELYEETGIEQNDLIVDPEFKFKQKYMVKSKRTGGKSKKKKLIIYAAKLIRPVELQLTEHESCQWFDWAPPHSIQTKTIDPLLSQFQQHQQKVADRLFVGGQPANDPSSAAS